MSQNDYRRFDIKQQIKLDQPTKNLMFGGYYITLLNDFTSYSTDDLNFIKENDFTISYRYETFAETLNEFHKLFKVEIPSHSGKTDKKDHRLSEWFAEYLNENTDYKWNSAPMVLNVGWLLAIFSIKLSNTQGGSPIVWASELRERAKKVGYFNVFSELSEFI